MVTSWSEALLFACALEGIRTPNLLIRSSKGAYYAVIARIDDRFPRVAVNWADMGDNLATNRSLMTGVDHLCKWYGSQACSHEPLFSA